MAVWTFVRFVMEVIHDRQTCEKWCLKQKLLPERRLCSEGHEMVLKMDTPIGTFRCRKNHSTPGGNRLSRLRGTFFEETKLSLEKALLITYCFCEHLSFSATCRHTRINGTKTSSQTVSSWFNYCKELIIVWMFKTQILEKLGGPGKVVDITKTKIAPRKFNLGDIKNGWLLCLVERATKSYRFIICPTEFDSEILRCLITKCVKLGTKLHTNEWEAFQCLGTFGYIHKISCNDEDNSVQLKQDVEHLFRQQCNRDGVEVFDRFLDVVRDAFPVEINCFTNQPVQTPSQTAVCSTSDSLQLNISTNSDTQ